jgi:hypothetical protein
MPHPAYHFGFPRQRYPIKRRNRQRDKNLDPHFQGRKDVSESLPLFDLGSIDSSRIRQTPVGGDRLTRPNRADFARCVIADGEYKIHDGYTGPNKSIPALAAQSCGRQVERPQEPDSTRIDRTSGKTAYAETPEAISPPMVQQRFREDAPSQVSGAEGQDIKRLARH